MSSDVTQLKAENQRLAQQNELLQHQLVHLQRQLEQSLNGNEELKQLLKELQAKLDVVIAQSKKRNKRDYGKKTEKHNPRPAALQPPPTVNASSAPERNASTGIKHILKNAQNLPHEPVHHPVKPDQTVCPDCCVETVFVSNLLSHQLEMVSASLKVLEHHQETRACPRCKQNITTAEKPCSPIPGSYAGPRLLGEIIVGKLDDGLPNYRQEKIFARHNVTIPRSTQSD